VWLHDTGEVSVSSDGYESYMKVADCWRLLSRQTTPVEFDENDIPK
jgi:hypothetical protein